YFVYIEFMKYDIINLIIYFFFSSRRRHTRSKRDWSSDVCSSDLKEIITFLDGEHSHEQLQEQLKKAYDEGRIRLLDKDNQPLARSEERRVGRKASTRWVGEQ